MNKFNLPLVGIGVAIAIITVVYIKFSDNPKISFETQSVRTTRSLGLGNGSFGDPGSIPPSGGTPINPINEGDLGSKRPPVPQPIDPIEGNPGLLPGDDSELYTIYGVDSGSQSINSIPCADMNGDGIGDIELTSPNTTKKRIRFKAVQNSKCECTHNAIDNRIGAKMRGLLHPYIMVNNEWKILDFNNRMTYCPNGFFLSNGKQVELLGTCNPEVTAFGYGFGRSEKIAISHQIMLSEFKNTCKRDDTKNYCTVTFSPNSSKVNQPFAVRVDGSAFGATIIDIGVEGKHIVQGNNNEGLPSGGGSKIFTGFPYVMKDKQNVGGEYLYTITLRSMLGSDPITSCTGSIFISGHGKEDPDKGGGSSNGGRSAGGRNGDKPIDTPPVDSIPIKVPGNPNPQNPTNTETISFPTRSLRQ